MNIHFHHSIWVLLTGFSLTACYKDIDLEKYRPEPTLVLNSILSPDTVVRVQVARTVFFTDHREAHQCGGCGSQNVRERQVYGNLTLR